MNKGKCRRQLQMFVVTKIKLVKINVPLARRSISLQDTG